MQLKKIIHAIPSFYCNHRISSALDTHSEMLLDECAAYDEAAASEEERVSSVLRALSSVVKMNSNNNIYEESEDAIQW